MGVAIVTLWRHRSDHAWQFPQPAKDDRVGEFSFLWLTKKPIQPFSYPSQIAGGQGVELPARCLISEVRQFPTRPTSSPALTSF
jgi:hypothetical protein